MKNLGSQSDPKDLGSVSLNISSASANNLVKINTVDASGRPTSYSKAIPDSDYQSPVEIVRLA